MGATKARDVASPFTARLRHAVGLRPLTAALSPTGAKAAKIASPAFKQYREKDGRFHFKLVDGQGQLLLESLGYATPKEAGEAIATLRRDGANALPALAAQLAFQGAQAPLVAALQEWANDRE